MSNLTTLEEINQLLPDNNNGEITEANLRQCFEKTFTELDRKADGGAIGNMHSVIQYKASIDASNIEAEKFYEAIKPFIPASSGGGTADISKAEVTKMLNDVMIGGENLVKNTLTPMLGANDTGTGTSVVMEDATGKFTRVTPASGKAVSLYGFRIEGSNDGFYSKSIDVRHSHSGAVMIWNKSIPPNKWTRIKLEKATDSEFFLLSMTTPNVPLDIRKLKIEHGTKATDWRPNTDEIMVTVSASKIDNVFNQNDLTLIGENNGSNDRAIYNIPNLDSITAILDLHFIFSDGTSVALQGAKSVMLSSGKKGIPFHSSIANGKSISKVYLRAILK